LSHLSNDWYWAISKDKDIEAPKKPLVVWVSSTGVYLSGSEEMFSLDEFDIIAPCVMPKKINLSYLGEFEHFVNYEDVREFDLGTYGNRKTH
jgi:hypothetical protein